MWKDGKTWERNFAHTKGWSTFLRRKILLPPGSFFRRHNRNTFFLLCQCTVRSLTLKQSVAQNKTCIFSRRRYRQTFRPPLSIPTEAHTMRFWTIALLLACLASSAYSWSTILSRKGGYAAKTHPLHHVGTLGMTESTLRMAESSETPSPSTFREAEVLGLRLMQEGNYQEALDGACLVVLLLWYFLPMLCHTMVLFSHVLVENNIIMHVHYM